MPQAGEESGGCRPSSLLGPLTPLGPLTSLPTPQNMGTAAPPLPPVWKHPRVYVRSGKQGVSTGAVELSPRRWHQAWSAVGRGASSQGAKENRSRAHCLRDAPQPRLGCTTLLNCQPTSALGAAIPGPPQGCRGASHGTNNSWRTNNLTRWSAGGEPSWGASPAAPAWPCLRGQTAAGQGRGSSSEAEAWGRPSGRAPPSPAPVCWLPQTLLEQAAPLSAGSPEGRGQQGGGQGRL